MKQTLKLLRDFEKRNNVSTTVLMCSDGSSSVHEYWSDDRLAICDNIEELHRFLKNTQYKLDETDGRCLFPVQIVEQ